MLPNEVFALECLARYAKEGLVRDGTWEFAHCPEPRPKGQKKRLPGDLGHYLTFFDHQHQGLLQSVDVGRKCYINYKVKLYLDTMPPGHEELRVIYDKFNKHTKEHKKKISKALKDIPLSEETKKKMKEARKGRTLTEEHKKKIGEAHSGEKHPMYGRTGALNPSSKAIIVIKPDGTQEHYGSICEAARKLKIPGSSLSMSLKKGHVITRGKSKGYKALHA